MDILKPTLQIGYCKVQMVKKFKEAGERSRNAEQKMNVWVWSSEAVFFRGRKSPTLIENTHTITLGCLRQILLDVKGEILTEVMSNSLT